MPSSRGVLLVEEDMDETTRVSHASPLSAQGRENLVEAPDEKMKFKRLVAVSFCGCDRAVIVGFAADIDC